MPRTPLALAAFLLLAVAGVSAQTSTADFPTIEDAAKALNLTTLLSVAQGTPVADLLISTDVQGIVLAPTNEAFQLLDESLDGGLASLTADQVAAVLQYHVIAGNESFPYIDNTTRTVNSSLLFGQAPSDVVNGNVSFVPVSMDNETYVYAGGIAPGALTTINASATAAQARVYVINQVLLPPSTELGANFSLTVAGAVANNSMFSLLVGAVTADPEVAALLSDPDAAYTVFAPTDDAFMKFLAMQNLTLADVGSLVGSPAVNTILKTHVLDTIPLLSTQLMIGTYSIPTLSGEYVNVTVSNSSSGAVSVQLQGAGNPEPVNVTLPDVLAGKSVAHVVDGVILPGMGNSTAM